MKIFVTIGTQAPFSRLDDWMNEYAETYNVDIYLQNMDSMLSEEAMEYVTRFPKIESVLFGASSRAHIQQTKELILDGFARPEK